MKRDKSRLGDLFWLGSVFVLALWLRLDRIWLVQFKRDEAGLFDQALRWVEGGPLPLVGNPSGAGVFNPPTFLYLISNPLRLWPDPLAPSLLLAGLGAGATLLVGYAGLRFFGRPAGVAAGVLYAVNPWAIWESRHIWEPDSVQLAAALVLFASLAYAVERRPWALWAGTLSLAVATQLHFSAVALAPVWLLALVIGWRQLRWRPLVVGGLLALLTYAPYLYGDAAHGWTNVQALLSQRVSVSRWDADAFDRALALVSDFGYFLPPELAGSGRLAEARLLAIQYGELGLMLAGVAGTLALVVRGGRGRLAAAAVLLAVVAPVALTLRHWLDLYVHYYLIMLPPLMLIAGLGAQSIGQALSGIPKRALGNHNSQPSLAKVAVSGGPRRLGSAQVSPLPSRNAPQTGTVAWALVALFVGGVALAQAGAYRGVMDRIQAGDRDRFLYGLPLQITREASERVTALGIRDLRVISSSSDLAISVRVLTRGSTQTEHYDSSRGFPLPDSAHTWYLALDDGAASPRLMAEISGSDTRWQDAEQSGPALTLYELTPGFRDRLLAGSMDSTRLKFDTGSTLVGVGYPRRLSPGQPIDVVTLWSNAEPPKPGSDTIVAFGIVEGADGRELARTQLHAHEPSQASAAGDWLSWLRIPVPADASSGAAYLRLGLVRTPGARPVNIATADGKPIGSEVRLGPMKINSGAPPSPQPQAVAAFGGSIALASAEVQRQGDGTVVVRLDWASLAAGKRDYQVFVHLLDSSGRLVAQADAPPGDLPTSLWDAGERYQSTHTLVSTAGARGERVAVGLYSLADGRRLEATDARGAPIGDAFAVPVP